MLRKVKLFFGTSQRQTFTFYCCVYAYAKSASGSGREFARLHPRRCTHMSRINLDFYIHVHINIYSSGQTQGNNLYLIRSESQSFCWAPRFVRWRRRQQAN